MPAIVNLDGRLVPPAEASVSVFDRGFLYGDSVYEVVRTYGGRPFELGAHLRRLDRSAERIGLMPPWDSARMEREIGRALHAARGEDPVEPGAAPWNVGERYIRVIVTRGAGEIGLDPALAVDPLSVVIVRPVHGPPASAYSDGVAGCVVGVQRISPQAIDPTAKTGNYLNSVLAVREARSAGAYEAVMLDRDGFVTEGSSSNVFAVTGGALRTPPVAIGILEGVTRDVVLGLARSLAIPAREEPLRPADLASAEELFITSTIREIVPITRLAGGHAIPGQPVGAGKVGPITARLLRAFRELTARA